MLSVMGLYHTQPRQVPSTPPRSSALEDHFLNLMPTAAESMVVQQEAITMMVRIVTPREIQVAFPRENLRGWMVFVACISGEFTV